VPEYSFECKTTMWAAVIDNVAEMDVTSLVDVGGLLLSVELANAGTQGDGRRRNTVSKLGKPVQRRGWNEMTSVALALRSSTGREREMQRGLEVFRGHEVCCTELQTSKKLQALEELDVGLR